MSPVSRRDRPQRLSAAARRERILEGAMRVFAKHGYEGASMSEIARAGDVTAAVIYDHFASKQELHGFLLEQQTEMLLAYVGEAVLAAGPQSEQRMRAGVDAFFGFVQEHPFAWRMIFRDPPADHAIATVHARIHMHATQGIAAILDNSAPDYLRDDLNREQTLQMFAEMLKMSLNGMAVWWYEHPSAHRSELVQRVMDFCWTGLQTNAGPTTHA
jgi:AcrR family transcriptional regulator